jgi:meiosis-specific APC/C activator protein AMA1
MGSGTNARLYTTSFSASKPKAQDEMEKHEGRLAEALELDRVARVFEFRDSPIPSRTRQSNGKPTSAVECKTVWKGTEWVMHERDSSKPPFILHQRRH